MIGSGLTLVTGATGSGKSAYIVSLLAEIKDRPLSVMGIPELQLEHSPCPPVSEWVELRPDPDDPSLLMPYFTFAANSIVVLDEAQRVYRPRPVGSKVPPEVAAFETRRHTGVDFVLITQHPTFIDANVRKLVTRHIHIHSTFLGRQKLEWVGLGDPDQKASRELAARTSYKPPSKAFGLYKSAELHTKPVVKRPWYFYVLPVLVVALFVGGWMISQRFKERAGNEPEKSAGANPVSGSGKGAVSHAKPATAVKAEVMTTAEYIEQYQPRIAGLHHTAPAYDDITKPVDAPIPVGCIDSKKTGCRCYDQQGNKYSTTDAICKQILADGIFFAWKKTEPYEPPSKKPEQAAQVAAIPVPAVVSSGPWNNSHVRELPGGSHNFTGGFKPEPPKQQDNTFTIKPAG